METKNYLIIIAILAGMLILSLFVCKSICKSRKNRIEEISPYELGFVYQEEEKSYIFVAFDATLIPENSSFPKTVYELLDKFWENPAQELNSFYTVGNPFGISLEISDVRKTSSGKFSFIVQDNEGRNYILKTEHLPETFEVSMQTSTKEDK